MYFRTWFNCFVLVVTHALHLLPVDVFFMGNSFSAPSTNMQEESTLLNHLQWGVACSFSLTLQLRATVNTLAVCDLTLNMMAGSASFDPVKVCVKHSCVALNFLLTSCVDPWHHWSNVSLNARMYLFFTSHMKRPVEIWKENLKYWSTVIIFNNKHSKYANKLAHAHKSKVEMLGQ